MVPRNGVAHLKMALLLLSPILLLQVAFKLNIQVTTDLTETVTQLVRVILMVPPIMARLEMTGATNTPPLVLGRGTITEEIHASRMAHHNPPHTLEGIKMAMGAGASLLVAKAQLILLELLPLQKMSAPLMLPMVYPIPS